MGLLDGVAAGFGAAAGAGAGYLMKSAQDEDMARIETEKQARLMELRNQSERDQTQWRDDFEHDYDRVARNRNEKIEDTKASKKAELDFNTENAAQMGKNEAAKAVAELTGKATPEALAAARKIAAAQRDPAQQRLLGIQIQEAELKLGEAKDKAAETKNIRNLQAASSAVDTGQPGADKAKNYYSGLINTAVENRAKAETLTTDRATSAQRAKQWTDLADKETDPIKQQEYRDNAAAALSASTPAAKVSQGSSIPVVKNADDFNALKPGEQFRDPDGNVRIKQAPKESTKPASSDTVQKASSNDFDVMLNDASRGGSKGRSYIQSLIDQGETFSPAQRKKMREAGFSV